MNNKPRRNIIYTGIQVTWRLILGNIFLLLTNIFLLALSLNIKFTLLTSIIYLIASITLFPSLVALVTYLRNQYVEDKVMAGAKVYFHAFKETFKTSWQAGLIYEILIIFLVLDLISANKFMKNGQFFMPLLTLLIILSIVHAMWNVLVQNYYYVSLKNSFIISAKLLIQKPRLSLLMILLIFVNYVLFKFFPQYAVLFAIPLTAYLLWRTTAKEFDELRRAIVIKK